MKEQLNLSAPVQKAMSELQALIAQHFPSTSFAIRHGIDDPQRIYLIATVDIEDPDQVMDIVLERLLELQLEQDLPINVVPVHTPERIAETRRRIDGKHGRRTDALPISSPT